MTDVRWYQSVTFRLVVVALLAAAVLAPVVFLVQHRVVEHARDRAVADYVRATLQSEEPSTCNELQHRLSPPRGRGGRPRGPDARETPRLVFLDDNFVPSAPMLLGVDDSMRAKLTQAGDWVAADFEIRRRPIRAIVVRLDESVGCRYVAAVRPGPRDDARNSLLLLVALGTGLAAGIAALVPGAWLARRIRILSQRVEDSGVADRDVDIRMSGQDEIAALSRVFSSNRAELLESADQVRRSREVLEEHIAQTSHDLRTPLTVLQQRLHRARSATTSDGTIDLLDAAMTDVSYVSSLLGNLNVRSRLQESQIRGIKTAPVNLGALTERVANRYSPLANARDVALNFAVPANTLTAEGDSTLLEQMLSNLLENAVKFVPEGGRVAVLLESNDGGFTWVIRDTGEGIQPRQWRELQARQTAGKRDSASSGGLGLQIAFEIAELHGLVIEASQSESDGFAISVSGARSS